MLRPTIPLYYESISPSCWLYFHLFSIKLVQSFLIATLLFSSISTSINHCKSYMIMPPKAIIVLVSFIFPQLRSSSTSPYIAIRDELILFNSHLLSDYRSMGKSEIGR